MNGLEHLGFLVPSLLLFSLYRPKIGVMGCGVVLIGRELYAYGYQNQGAGSVIKEVGGVSAVLFELFCVGTLLAAAVWRRGLHKRLHK